MESEWHTPYGNVFQPFVIVERGQLLDEEAPNSLSGRPCGRQATVCDGFLQPCDAVLQSRSCKLFASAWGPQRLLLETI
jgi:hypothetical protein